MSSVDEIFTAFKAAYRAGEDADPNAFLERADPASRGELGALISGFLARASPPPVTRAGFESFRATARAERLVSAIDERAGERLPQIRDTAQMTRDDLVKRLATALGIKGRKEEKVQRYYHQLERGSLDVGRVSPRVFEELSRLLGVGVERLKEAATRAAPSAPAATMARMTMPEADFQIAAPAAAAAPAPQRGRTEWDEVDELFLGGRD